MSGVQEHLALRVTPKNTSVDMYVGGADSTGTNAYTTGESYYDAY